MYAAKLADDPEAQSQIEAARRGDCGLARGAARRRAACIRPCSAATGSASRSSRRPPRSAVPVKLNVAVENRLDESIEVAAYYVVTESLANIGRHAHAKRATVGVTRRATSWSWRWSTTGSAAPTASGDRASRLADRVAGRAPARVDPRGAAPVCAPRCRAVALAEDSVLLRDGLGRLLNDEGFEVVAQCEDAVG